MITCGYDYGSPAAIVIVTTTHVIEIRRGPRWWILFIAIRPLEFDYEVDSMQFGCY